MNTRIWLAIFLFFGMAAFGFAEETKEVKKEKEEVVKKEVMGEVSGISPNFIAIVYGQNQEKQSSLEMAFDLNKDVVVTHKKSLSEIGMGDTVKVDYDQITKTKDDGTKISRRLARMVTFLRKAAKKPELTESASPADSGEVAPEPDEESLPLPIKGIKQE
jgi:hypothetical protein